MQYDKGQLIDEIATALHPHWPVHSRKTYLPLSLPAMVRSLVAKVQADARALWSVRVLDAFTASMSPAYSAPVALPAAELGHPYVVFVTGDEYYGETPDAARLAAAQAVFPTLDRSAPDWPGECP